MKYLLLLLSLSFSAYARPGSPDCRGDLASAGAVRAQDSGERDRFIAEFAELVFADEIQNQTWIDDALANHPNDIHVLIENSWLKKLNDKILKNKDLVTALTNFHKKLFVEELNALALALKVAPYQDFKSIRLTLADSHRLNELVNAFNRTNQRFYQDERVRAVVRDEDLRESWFRMGLGQSEVQAALAARDARDHGQNGVSYFWDTRLRERLSLKLNRVKELHQWLTDKLQGSTLLVRERDYTGLHLDVFAAARKASSKDIWASLQQIFPSSGLDRETALKILEYAGLVDEFSPSVLVAKRELLTITEAPFGAFSIDFIGLGAENLRGTAKALVKAKDLNDAARLTRFYEREVTKTFEARKASVRAAVLEYFAGQVSIRFSGDDGIIIPEREIILRDRLWLVQKLAQLLSRPYFRMSDITAEGAANPDSSQLITHAESMEKVLRPLLVKHLGAARVEELSLEIFIPDTDHFRKVFLIMNGKKKIPEAEKKVIRNAFPTAVKLVEEAVRKQGLDLEYDPTDIFAIFGKKPF